MSEQIKFRPGDLVSLKPNDSDQFKSPPNGIRLHYALNANDNHCIQPGNRKWFDDFETGICGVVVKNPENGYIDVQLSCGIYRFLFHYLNKMN